MKRIKLNHGYSTIIDDDFYDWLNQWKWYCDGGYACRRQYFKDGSSKKIRMHRLINATPNGYDTDHINRNKLDNRRSNLRTATRSQNVINHGMLKNNTSGYKGIRWHTLCNKWQARFTYQGKAIYLGTFAKLEDAVRARNIAVLEVQGKLAHRNEI